MSWTEHLISINWKLVAGVCLFAYALGCFTSGYYLVRWFTGQDVRVTGSGSVGARNVSRVLGRKGFFLTVFFDVAKGMLAVCVVRRFTPEAWVVLLAMVAVVAGHVWPAQLHFHGGKGMATSLGSLLVFDGPLSLTFAALFLCLALLMRKTVLPGLMAIGTLPLAALLLHHPASEVTLLSFWSGLVLLAHRRNLVEEVAHLAVRRHSHPPQPNL